MEGRYFANSSLIKSYSQHLLCAKAILSYPLIPSPPPQVLARTFLIFPSTSSLPLHLSRPLSLPRCSQMARITPCILRSIPSLIGLRTSLSPPIKGYRYRTRMATAAQIPTAHRMYHLQHHRRTRSPHTTLLCLPPCWPS